MAAFVPDHVSRLPNDIGGAEAGPTVQVEHELLPWEKRCHALADVLDFRKIVNTEEKRKGVEALGETLIGQLPYYERWTVAFANILFAKGLLTPSELARKMQEIEARFAPASGAASSQAAPGAAGEGAAFTAARPGGPGR